MRSIAIIASLALAGCAGDTAGKLVQVAWEFEQASDEEHAHFTTETGWDVSLDEARVAVGAVYAFAPAADKPGAIAWLERCCVSVAHAHGGLDAESGRRVRAELIERVVVDVLGSDPSIQPRDSAEEGALDEVKIELGAGGLTGGASVYARGEAVHGEQRVRFEAPVVLGSEAKARSVELTGLSASIRGDSKLVVSIDPSRWFQHCEFDRLTASDAGDVVTVPSDNQVGRALTIGVRSPEAFGFSVSLGD